MSETPESSLSPSPARLWLDGEHTAAHNMAMDEAILLHIPGQNPLIRFYSWSEPALTIGYFQSYSANLLPDCALIRRPSGGGRVDHRNDFTFSLTFNAGHPLYHIDRFESYRQINAVVSSACRALGYETELFSSDIDRSIDRTIMQCFTAPAKHDVMLSGNKVAGGAQRRTSTGMLHQGSILLDTLPKVSKSILAEALEESFGTFFGNFAPFSPDAKLLAEAENLRNNKYGAEGWNQKT